MALRARQVFEGLGYTVVSDGGALEARRDNRTVEIVPVTDGDVETPEGGRDGVCYVGDKPDVEPLERDPPADVSQYAVIGLDGESYDVIRSP